MLPVQTWMSKCCTGPKQGAVPNRDFAWHQTPAHLLVRKEMSLSSSSRARS